MTNIQNDLRSQLMHALYDDDFSKVIELLNNGVKVNLPYNHHKWTPFLWVCKEHSDPEIIQLFLEHGGNTNSKNDEGSTPLHIMARHRSSFTALGLLIDAGADVNAQDNDGWTPLMDAVKHPQAMMRKDVIRNLAKLSDTSITNNDGKTAYDIAKENEAFDDEVLLLLLKNAEALTDEEFSKVFSTFLGDSND